MDPLNAVRADIKAMALAPDADPVRIKAQVNKAAEEFEALFAQQMLQPMFKGLKSDGMFSGGHAEDTWRGFMIEALGDQIAKSGGLGIADAVRASLFEQAGLSPNDMTAFEPSPSPSPFPSSGSVRAAPDLTPQTNTEG